jgi:hypothetical protein
MKLDMKRSLPIAVILICFAAPLFAQTGETPETPLGDIARALRKSKKPPEQTVVDNDNLTKVMDEAETRRAKGSVKFSFEGSGRDVQVSSPEVTCSLSFNGDGPAAASDSSSPLDLPSSELVKLDGPASINGDTLQIAVYNPTGWKVNEITVGLTILRPAGGNAANYGEAKLVPAAAVDSPSQKRSDVTVLYHLKGSASPFTTALFKQSIGISLNADQEWHWAIVQARGIPPK